MSMFLTPHLTCNILIILLGIYTVKVFKDINTIVSVCFSRFSIIFLHTQGASIKAYTQIIIIFPFPHNTTTLNPRMFV